MSVWCRVVPQQQRAAFLTHHRAMDNYRIDPLDRHQRSASTHVAGLTTSPLWPTRRFFLDRFLTGFVL
jgi:hypothetical protein